MRPEYCKLQEQHDVRPLYESVDPGCLEYVRDLFDKKELNKHQFEALVIALSQMSGAGQSTSSISMIQGPPGTGKTQSIVNLIGALVHHSEYGHVGEGIQRHNLLKRDDGLLRSSKKHGALKILVTAGSNQAVDNALRALDKGIPDGKGNRIRVQAIRLARTRYNFKELKKHSINEKALEFDEHFDALSSSRNLPRASATSRARRAVADETIVFFATNTLVGSKAFLDLKQEVDVVINDEVSTVLEPESLIPMTVTRKRSKKSRLHYVGVGDFSCPLFRRHRNMFGPIAIASHLDSVMRSRLYLSLNGSSSHVALLLPCS